MHGRKANQLIKPLQPAGDLRTCKGQPGSEQAMKDRQSQQAAWKLCQTDSGGCRCFCSQEPKAQQGPVLQQGVVHDLAAGCMPIEGTWAAHLHPILAIGPPTQGGAPNQLPLLALGVKVLLGCLVGKQLLQRGACNGKKKVQEIEGRVVHA